MVQISNIKVYDLEESIIAASYAMRITQVDIEERIKNLKNWISEPQFINFATYCLDSTTVTQKQFLPLKDDCVLVRVFQDNHNYEVIISAIVALQIFDKFLEINDKNELYADDQQIAIKTNFDGTALSYTQYLDIIDQNNNIQTSIGFAEAVHDIQRIIKLARAPQGSGHRNAIKGIRVSFDIKYPDYISPELQRYGFVDIVCSSSKMHRLMVMDMDTCFNKYVTEGSKEQMRQLITAYNSDKTYENFMRVLSNCPIGIELFMRCSTNYEQLTTIYRQRKNHKLKEDWGAFCDFIRELPMSKQLITME